MLTLISKIKWTAVILLFIAAFIAGAKFASTSTTQVVTKEVKGETVTIVRDRIITVTKIVRPDGTVEETTKTEEKDSNKTKKETSKGGDVIVYRLPKYSLGYVVRPKWPSKDAGFLSRPEISHGVTAGYHIGYNVWLKAGAIPADKIYTLGVEVQF